MRNRNIPTISVVDLFSGCGGLSYGFEEQGYNVILAVDIDINCEKTYKRNFPKVSFLRKDITSVKNGELKKLLKAQKVNVVVGGPPCQGFSLANKNRGKEDNRNNLIYEFVRVVDCLDPEVFLVENVMGMLSFKNRIVINSAVQKFSNAGKKYNVGLFKVNAAQYGVPQTRNRIFILGVRKDIGIYPSFPVPSITDEKDYVTVRDAINDLPLIKSGEGAEFFDYSKDALSVYQRKMRAGSDGVRNHIAMVHTKRLIARFETILLGQSVKDVLKEHSAVKRGDPTKKSGRVFSQNNLRVYPDRPAPTIAASFQSNFIHPFLNRNFTAREGARLQSFPDSFVFEGMRTKMSWEEGLSQYQQIGNAVPPILAKEIARHLKKYFKERI